MSFVEAIAHKRGGRALDREQIEFFVAGACDGSLPPEQIGAMLMAVCCRGMTPCETRWLTQEMLNSGEVWRLAADQPEAVDKHSTGGVGDTVSLVFAPLLAAVGVPVAMMAGRGLGHTQGTLDKLGAIPGFRCDRSRTEVSALVEECGVAFVAQTENIAPADRVLYAMRDVTGTVPSLPLITSSIMSKKLALGAAKLVLDVKWGRGAFCRTMEDAVELATALREVASGVGVAFEAIVTDMNQPLGGSLGTACEVRSAIEVLSDGGGSRLRRVSLRLAREALVLHGWQPDAADLELEAVIEDGRALNVWNEMVVAHGGDPDQQRLAEPESSIDVYACDAGWLTGVAATSLGWVAAEIGAGRRTRDEVLAYGAGLEVHVQIGDKVEQGQPLATIHLGDRAVDVDAVVARVAAAFEIGQELVEPPQLILGTVAEVQASSSGG